MAKTLFGGAIKKSIINKIIVVVLLVIFIILAIMIANYYSISNSNSNAKNISNMANVNSPGLFGQPGKVVSGFDGSMGGDLQVYFFHVDWCPHCVRAKPEWEQFVSKYNNQMKNGYSITCVGGAEGSNCTNDDDVNVRALIQKYDIQHFPTVKFIKNGQVIDFDGKVDMANLESFIETM